MSQFDPEAPSPGSNFDIPPVSLAQAAKFWFKLGFISFGGPAGQIATLHEEVVEKKHWISEKRFLHALNYCMLLPGPEALQLIIYIGWLMHRGIGGLVAGLLFILPALCLLILLSWIYVSFGQTTLLVGIFIGIKPAVTAIVLQAGIRIGQRILKSYYHWLIALGSLIGITLLKAPYPFVILSAAVIGFLIHRQSPGFSTSASHTKKISTQHIKAFIDDDTPPPAHAIFKRESFIQFGLIFLAAWLIPLALLSLINDPQKIYLDMGLFFTKAALMTFGGAYAVLPYVYQGAVDHFHWLNPLQMMDGLALGETTPGPLILIVAFVGYIGAQSHTLIGDSSFLSGTLGAIIASWFIFLPSFCFIFLGGPLVESTRTELKLSGPLTGINCAIVGVITSLILFFASHTFWPLGLMKHPEIISWSAIIICGLASFALIYLKRSVIEVLAFCAMLGLLLQSFV
jgi:chromate transporter